MRWIWILDIMLLSFVHCFELDFWGAAVGKSAKTPYVMFLTGFMKVLWNPMILKRRSMWYAVALSFLLFPFLALSSLCFYFWKLRRVWRDSVLFSFPCDFSSSLSSILLSDVSWNVSEFWNWLLVYLCHGEDIVWWWGCGSAPSR